MRFRPCLLSLLLLPTLAPGASREIVELQRDVATLQDQIRALSSGTNEKLTAITVLLQQTLEATNNTSKSVAVLESRVNDRLEKQTASVGQPVAVLGAKVDQMSNDFVSVRNALSDMLARMGKLEQRLVDLDNAIRTIQAPPPAPGGGAPGPSGAAAIPSGQLYDNAVKDMMTGKPDMALRGFNDYLQAYGDTANAQDAQFYIGQIHYDQNDLPNALKDFDAVLERYTSSTNDTRAPDALLMKGRTLVKMERRNDGAKEFRALLSKYPHHTLAKTACSELKALGLSCSASAPAPVRKKRAGA
jgi:TolA-binding protein